MGYNCTMVNIIGYEDVVVGTETVQKPIYDEEVIIVGVGENAQVLSLAEYEASMVFELGDTILP